MKNQEEKIHCLNCLSIKESQLIENQVVCPDCLQPVELYLNITAPTLPGTEVPTN